MLPGVLAAPLIVDFNQASLVVSRLPHLFSDRKLHLHNGVLDRAQLGGLLPCWLLFAVWNGPMDAGSPNEPRLFFIVTGLRASASLSDSSIYQAGWRMVSSLRCHHCYLIQNSNVLLGRHVPSNYDIPSWADLNNT